MKFSLNRLPTTCALVIDTCSNRILKTYFSYIASDLLHNLYKMYVMTLMLTHIGYNNKALVYDIIIM